MFCSPVLCVMSSIERLKLIKHTTIQKLFAALPNADQEVLLVCPLLISCLKGVIALTRHNEIWGEFAFCQTRFIHIVEAMLLMVERQNGLVSFSKVGQAVLTGRHSACRDCLCVEVVIARRAQHHLPA